MNIFTLVHRTVTHVFNSIIINQVISVTSME